MAIGIGTWTRAVSRGTAALAMATALAAPAAAEEVCGGEVPCAVSSGQYYIHVPEDLNGQPPNGAIFFLHGFRGSALNEIRQKNFLKLADRLGVAFVAVAGLKGTWSFPSAPRALRDEFAFFDEVIEDVSVRHGVDKERTLLSGFSSGGFMTWYLACDEGRRFGGYAPIAGAFWKPLPEECPTEPPYLFHVHGTSDKVVPLAGRPLGGGQWHQGDVFESFRVWRRQFDLPDAPVRTYTEGALRCEEWQPATGLLELCLHDGGHSIRTEWLERAWTRLGTLRGWD